MKKIGIGTSFRPIFNAGWLILIGFLIYITQKKIGFLPQKLSLIKMELQSQGTANYRYVLLQLVIPALILTSGTSLGPEATLVSSTVLYGIWILDKLRFLNSHWNEGTGVIIKSMLVPHRYLESRGVKRRSEKWWNWLTVSYLAAGILSFFVTCKYGGEPSVIVYLGPSSWMISDLIWLLPITILGILFGQFWMWLMANLREIIVNRVTNTGTLIILGGGLIYLATLFAPQINFSGMLNFHLLATSWQAESPLFLFIHSALKLGLLTVCLNTGWLGGEIFPVLFCATTQGIALSQLLTQVDAIFLIGIFAISMGTVILKSPLIAGGIMAIMFLPPNLLVINLGLTFSLYLIKYWGAKVSLIRVILP